MIYLTLLTIGIVGLGIVTLLGGGHGGHIAHAGNHSGTHDAGGNTAHGSSRALSAFWSIVSPVSLFSLCLGAGAAGLLLKHLHEANAITTGGAFLGAIVFYALITRPLSSFLMQFASRPSQALEGSIASTADAMGPFDSQGRGMIQLVVDGEIIRVLATLDHEDLSLGGNIRKGEKLLVTSVDAKRNRCQVTVL